MSKHRFFSCLLAAGLIACSTPVLAGSHGGSSFSAAPGGRGGSVSHGGSGFRGGPGFRGGSRWGHNGYRNHGYARNWGHGGRYYRNRWYPYGGFGFYGSGYPYYGGSYYPYDAPFAYYGDTPYYGYSYYPQPVGSSEAQVQVELAQRGYYNGPIDGILGPASYRAIRAFQAAHGLAPTGQVDSNLLRALRK